VRSAISKTLIKPSNLKLELTESLVMENPEQSAHVLSRLKDMGVGLSLDDFGTGYSSLSYLTRFPFDTIKIDRTFLTGDLPQKKKLLRAIVAMAHDLGLAVVTEGVETDKDARQLRQIQCEFAQGFMFGQPVSADQALGMMKLQFPLAETA